MSAHININTDRNRNSCVMLFRDCYSSNGIMIHI